MIAVAINMKPRPNVSPIIASANVRHRRDLAVAVSSFWGQCMVAVGVTKVPVLLPVAVGLAAPLWRHPMALSRTKPKPHVVGLETQVAAILVGVGDAQGSLRATT
jgi:hypothetical protein